MEKCKYLSSVITIVPVLNTKRDEMGTMGILLEIDDGVYVCICTVYSSVFKEVTQNALFYDSHFSTKEKSECCGATIDNR